MRLHTSEQHGDMPGECLFPDLMGDHDCDFTASPEFIREIAAFVLLHGPAPSGIMSLEFCTKSALQMW